MEKDLAMSGVSHSFRSEIDADHLISDLADHLKLVEKRNLLSTLLYRIDLNVDLSSLSDFRILSQKAWNRVLQKVVTRITYSKSIEGHSENDDPS